MIYSANLKKTTYLFFILISFFLFSCNKNVQQFVDPPLPTPPAGLALGETLAARPTDSLYLMLIIKAGLLPVINNKAATFTMFVPDNTAMKLFINAISGGAVPLAAPDAVFSGFISANIPMASAVGIVSYNISGQALTSANIPASFPNLQYPTILNPAPTLSALLRLTTFPSTRNGAWVNNVPLTAVDLVTANGIIHHTGAVVATPQKFLWDRINTDAALTYLKAAINRADSGTASPGTLQGALLNIGANLTVFAPTDSAFKVALTGAIAKALIGMGVPPSIAVAQATLLASTPAVFSNPALFSVLTAQTVKGIIVYHILGYRAFTNNFPVTTTYYPTLLNGAISIHPGVGLTATFGMPFVNAATVKGVGNSTAANIIINSSPLTPEPVGTSDQHYLNGVLHKIDQVLLPQ